MSMADMGKIGSWAFVVGLVIAIIMGFMKTGGVAMWVIAFLGLIVGLINVTHHEAMLHLVASIAFLVSASSLNIIMPALAGVLSNIVVFVAPSAAIVALRALYDIARSK